MLASQSITGRFVKWFGQDFVCSVHDWRRLKMSKRSLKCVRFVVMVGSTTGECFYGGFLSTAELRFRSALAEIFVD